MVRFAAFNQSVTRLSAPIVLDQQPPAQPQPPAQQQYTTIYRLILVDGIVGPVQQGNVSGAFDAYTWTMNNEFTNPRYSKRHLAEARSAAFNFASLITTIRPNSEKVS